MTYTIASIVLFVIIALVILYTSRRGTQAKIDRQKREAAESGDEQRVTAGEKGLFSEGTEKETVAREKEEHPAAAVEKADRAEHGLDEQELDLSFDVTASKTGPDHGTATTGAGAGLSVEEAEFDLLFEEMDTIPGADNASVQTPRSGAEGEKPVPAADDAAAGTAEEEIPFILEEEERLPGKSGDEIAPALDGVAEEFDRVIEETPESLAERLDLFFSSEEEEPPAAEEISEIEVTPAEEYQEDAGELTVEGYGAGLRELEKKLRRQMNEAIRNRETFKLALLEKKLTAVCGKLADLSRSFLQKKQLLDEIENIFADLKSPLPGGFENESVGRQLRKGDVEVVRALLNEAVSQLDLNPEVGSRIRYLMGSLAEEEADYASASALYHQACVEAGDEPRYLYAAGRMARILGNDAEARMLLEKLPGGEGRLQDGALQALGQFELAKLYADADENEKAEPLLQTSLAGLEAHLGVDHPDLGPVLHDLAAWYERSGRYEEAEPLYRRALEVTENVLGEGHPNLASTQYRLAGLYEEMELEEKSAPLYEKALEIKIRVLGQEHPDVGTILNHLANLLRRQDRYEQAEPMFIRSLEIFEKALGRDHPNLAVVLNNLAELYGEKGNEEKAQQYQERALALFQLPGTGGDFVEIEKDHTIDENEEKVQTIAGS